MWRGGCIIRSAFLGKIKEAFDKNPKLVNLMVDPFFAGELGKAQSGWRRAVGGGGERHSASGDFEYMAYYDGYRTGRLPANLLKRNATSSARTPTSDWTSRAVSSSHQLDRPRQRHHQQGVQRVVGSRPHRRLSPLPVGGKRRRWGIGRKIHNFQKLTPPFAGRRG